MKRVEWAHHEIPVYTVQGTSLAEENFIQEDRTSIEMLIREVVQNILDARRHSEGTVRAVIRCLGPGEYDNAYLRNLLDDDYLKRLRLSARTDEVPNLEHASVLVIEDFGTTGLSGTTDNSNIDGPGQNWNAFWFREGEGAKANSGSNGRAGQGKVTYYRLSRARCVIGLTKREDGRKLLMGRGAFVNTYSLPDETAKYDRYTYWAIHPGSGQPTPVENDKVIAEFETAFGLTRGDESGLSLVIPLPDEFNADEAIRAVIQEFYLPVLRGRLSLSVNGVDINSGNIESLALERLSAPEGRTFNIISSQGYRGFLTAISKNIDTPPTVVMPVDWDSASVLQEGILPEPVLQNLRDELAEGKIIAVRFPVRISPRHEGGATSGALDVYLEKPDDLQQVEEMYMRNDLMIASERSLRGSLTRVRGLTYVGQGALSDFLAEAEEPTHLRWNANRLRLTRNYKNASVTLRAVRQAMPRLLKLLIGSSTTEDWKALAQYFPKASATGPRPTSGSGTPGKGKITKPPVDVPKAKPRKFEISTDQNWIEVKSVGVSDKEMAQQYRCTLELAYEDVSGKNPFDAYDPFDFDLSDTKNHSVSYSGIDPETIDRSENIFRFTTLQDGTPANVKISGFDTNIRLRARLFYKGIDDADDQQEE